MSELESVSVPATNSHEQMDHIKGVIETILFVHEKPVTIDQLKDVLATVGLPEIKKAIKELQENFDSRNGGVKIVEIAGGYQMLSNATYASYVREFYKTKHKEKLSKPSLETLAIIAYKQPVARMDVELIRGVNSDGIVTNLLEKELIKVVGRKDTPGNPFLYGTTKQFMEYFGLKSLQDLPKLEELTNWESSHAGTTHAIDTASGDKLNSLEKLKQSAIAEEKVEMVETVSATQSASSVPTAVAAGQEGENPEDVLKEVEQTLKVQKAALAKAKQFLEEAEDKNIDEPK